MKYIISMIILSLLLLGGCSDLKKPDPGKSCVFDSDCEYRNCIGCYNINSSITHSCPRNSFCECIGPFKNVECGCRNNTCYIKSFNNSTIKAEV
jgi:hypothetical protein